MMLAPDSIRAIITVSILTPLSTLFLGLRLSKRRKLLGGDDWLLCFALIFLYLQAGWLYVLAIKGGEGKAITELTPNELTTFFKAVYWGELSYTVSVAAIKISILWSYNRIFGGLKWFRLAVITIGLLVLGWFIGVFLSVLLQCVPIDKTWNPSKPGHCIQLVPFLWGNSISCAIFDYLILLLPVMPVWKLQIGIIQRYLVLASFSLGSLASISSTLRAAQTKTVDLTNISASVFKDSVWTIIEPNAGVISACLPYLANILGQKFLNFLKLLSSFASRTSSILLLRSRTNRSTTEDSHSIKMRLSGAAAEAYKLDSDHSHPIPKFNDVSISEASLNHPV